MHTIIVNIPAIHHCFLSFMSESLASISSPIKMFSDNGVSNSNRLFGISLLSTWLAENAVFTPKSTAVVFSHTEILELDDFSNKTEAAHSTTPKSPW